MFGEKLTDNRRQIITLHIRKLVPKSSYTSRQTILAWW